MSTTSSSSARPVPVGRTLVLGGGGSTGNAWLIGTLAGLADAGLDVATADRVVGTSAGSTTAAQIGGAPLADLVAAVLGPAPRQHRPVPGTGSAAGAAATRSAADQLARTAAIIAAAQDPADLRRRLGAAALELEGASDGT